MITFLRHYLFFLFLSIIVSPVFSSDNLNAPTNNNEWELISKIDGIEMFERWVKLDKNLKVRERTGKMMLRCSVDDVLGLISDASKTHQWMCNVEKVTVLKENNDKDWVVHTILDAPWPFTKQDIVSNYKVVEDESTGIINVLVLSEKNLLPKQKDIDRLDTFNAEWIIKPVGDNKVKVTFTTKSTRPPEYPSWVQDPVVRKIFITNLKNFKVLLASA